MFSLTSTSQISRCALRCLYLSISLTICCETSSLLPPAPPAEPDKPQALPDAPSLVVRGLAGRGLVIDTASGRRLLPDADTSYPLNSIGALRARDITVQQQPIGPAQTCQVEARAPHIIVECIEATHAPCTELVKEGNLPLDARVLADLNAIADASQDQMFFTSIAPINNQEVFASTVSGQVWKIDLVTGRSTLALDLAEQVVPTESGLVAFRLSPNFHEDMHAFGLYDAHIPTSPTTTLSRFRYSPETETFGNEQVLIKATGRPVGAYAHSGGDIAFDGQGHIFASFGDGTFRSSPAFHFEEIQSLDNLNGKIARLDISEDEAAIPEDNPFFGSEVTNVRKEIYALGLRNPFRMSFDTATDTLWVADVGQADWEEVNRISSGGNYGWPAMEGPECIYNAPVCNPADFRLPFYAYRREVGKSITGGLVLRQSKLPELDGFYIFGDYVHGSIRAIDTETDAESVTSSDLIARTPSPVDMTQMPDGRVVVLGLFGSLHELVPAPAKDKVSNIAESGCLDAMRELMPGFSAYDVSASFWSDGADKQRFVHLPEGNLAYPSTNGQINFPIGSIFVKEFSREGRRLETRFIWRPESGDWRAATFVWDATGRVATRVSEGTTLDLGAGETWEVPSETGCFQCHTEASGVVLGAEVNQLARAIDWRGRPDLNQLDLWTDLGYLPEGSGSLDHGQPLSLVSGTLEQQARSYLHANCASCHRPGSGGRSRMDLRSVTPLSSTAMCDVVPLVDDLGLANARLVAPGAPERSVLLSRLSSTGVHQMPPVGIVQPDPQGIDILTRWIEALTGCE